MKKKHLIIFGALAALVAVYLLSILPNLRNRAEWKQTVATLQSLPHDRLAAAASAFSRDRKTTNKTVALGELLSSGYLRAEDVRGLEDRDVSVSVVADETSPQMVLIRVRANDGSQIALLVDGSIQKMARQR